MIKNNWFNGWYINVLGVIGVIAMIFFTGYLSKSANQKINFDPTYEGLKETITIMSSQSLIVAFNIYLIGGVMAIILLKKIDYFRSDGIRFWFGIWLWFAGLALCTILASGVYREWFYG
jgi:succinate dehydrogenase hydrophobic anchor subunit